MDRQSAYALDDFTPRNTRRAKWHDYRSRSIYMITISKAQDVPAFSRIDGNPLNPIVTLSRIGKVINEQLNAMTQKYSEMVIYKRVIMPDHIHFVLDVTKPTDYHLGKAIGWFKGACSRGCWKVGLPSSTAVFSEGFHDRILLKSGQLEIMKRYVADNPRRYLVKKQHPDFFAQRHLIIINDEPFHAIGNIFLLRETLIEAVRVSRKYTPEQLQNYIRKWKFTISEGGVLVSPFISPAEREYRDMAINNGGSLIILNDNGFGERYKPSGRYFDLCAAGRLLMLAPVEQTTARKTITRQQALHLNDVAALVAGGNFTVTLRN